MFTGIGYQHSYFGSSDKKYKHLEWINDDMPISICIQKTNTPQKKVNFLVITESKVLFLCSIKKELDSGDGEHDSIESIDIAHKITDAMFIENFIVVLVNNNVTVRSIDTPKSPICLYHFDQKILKLSSANGVGFAIFQHFKSQVFHFNHNSLSSVNKAMLITFTVLTQRATEEPFVVVKTREEIEKCNDKEKEEVGDFKYTAKSVFYTDLKRKTIYSKPIGVNSKSVAYDRCYTIIDFDVRDGNAQEIIAIETTKEHHNPGEEYGYNPSENIPFDGNYLLDLIMLNRTELIDEVPIEFLVDFLKFKTSIQLEYYLDNNFFCKIMERFGDLNISLKRSLLELIIDRQKNAFYVYGIRASKRAEFLDDYECVALRPPLISSLQEIWRQLYQCKKEFAGEERNKFIAKMIEMIPYIEICPEIEILTFAINNNLFCDSYELTEIIVDYLGKGECLTDVENVRLLWKIYKWINIEGKTSEMGARYSKIAEKISRITRIYKSNHGQEFGDVVYDYIKECNHEIIENIKRFLFDDIDKFVRSIDNLIYERMPLRLNDHSKRILKDKARDMIEESKHLIKNQAKVSILEAAFFKHELFNGLEELATKD